MGRPTRACAGGSTPATGAASACDGFAQNTWRTGLDRLLLGVTMARRTPTLARTALPLDDVGSSRRRAGRPVRRAGRPAGHCAVAAARRRQPADRVARRAARRGGRRPDQRATTGDEWQIGAAAHRAGRRPRRRRSWAEHTVLTAARRARAAARPARAAAPPARTSAPAPSPCAPWCRCGRCRTGWSACSAWTTACSPAGSRVDGDDMLARDPAVGERDPRSEDRQLLLDAILAATEHLVITYTGADERTGAPRPPAVPLGELLDALDATATGADGTGRDARHGPTPAAAVRRPQLRQRRARSGGPFSFDPAALAGARARGPPAGAATRRSCPRRCPRPPPDAVELADLVASADPPGTRVPAPASGCRRAVRATTSPPTTCPSSWTRCRNGRSATGCCGDRLAGAGRADLS